MINGIIFDWVGTLYQFGGKGLFPYSEKVLKELHLKYKLGLISKAVADNVENRLKQINEFKDYFSFVIIDIDKTPEQFTQCMKELKLKPKETAVVDDRMDRGIQIGNQLDCVTYWIKNGKYSDILPNKKTGQPNYIINSVEDLLKLL
jgi:FMN phosphatase YigB (HAD superfamily)